MTTSRKKHAAAFKAKMALAAIKGDDLGNSPLRPPSIADWTELDESERLDLVLAYHEKWRRTSIDGVWLSARHLSWLGAKPSNTPHMGAMMRAPYRKSPHDLRGSAEAASPAVAIGPTDLEPRSRADQEALTALVPAA
jgi:hypothetical protein